MDGLIIPIWHVRIVLLFMRREYNYVEVAVTLHYSETCILGLAILKS